MASLGARSLADVIGRTDLLEQVSRGASNLDDLDLNPLLVRAEAGAESPFCTVEGRNEVPDTLDAQIARDAKPFLEDRAKMQLVYSVKNTHRAIGARTSSAIVRKYGMGGLPPNHLTVELHGSCGQSLGAFAVQGLKLDVWGDANDYVGKGLSGGTIVIRPGERSRLKTNDNTIIGNTVLYGATSGRLFAAGQAGERSPCAIRARPPSSKGCGANGCEYMTGGTVVILGPVGDNFGAGMTGGMAFIYDPQDIDERINPDTVVVQRVASKHWEGVLRAPHRGARARDRVAFRQGRFDPLEPGTVLAGRAQGDDRAPRGALVRRGRRTPGLSAPVPGFDGVPIPGMLGP